MKRADGISGRTLLPMLFLLLLAAGLLPGAAGAARAQDAPPAEGLRLPALFSSGMVVQRGRPVPVWGWAAPGSGVAVTFRSQTVRATAGADSTWRVELPATEAGGPYAITVTGAGAAITLEDVLVGEVWLASGQSNMEWPVEEAMKAAEELAASEDAQLRLFTVERDAELAPEPDAEGTGWQRAGPETVAPFSAVAYYFGRQLRRTLGVPVGLISSSWGGTAAEAWTDRAALNELPGFGAAIRELDAGPQRMDTLVAQRARAVEGERLGWERQVEAWAQEAVARDPGYEDGRARWAAPGYDASGWPEMELPRLWEGAGLPAFDGVVWFRKEVDVPAAWAGQDLMLALGPIDDVDTTWFGGAKVGSTDAYDAPRRYRVPAEAVAPGRNLIAVRVTDTGGGGGFHGTGAEMTLAPAGGSADALSLAGPWSYRTAFSLEEHPQPEEPAAVRPQDVPSALYNAMIAPLVPYALRGVIWYQGESNAGTLSRAVQYRTLFPALIQSWRTAWDRPDLPFLFVQLANFRERQTQPVEAAPWPALREAQLQALQRAEHTAMAVAIDIGADDDIHPRNKQEVGRRLAFAALGTTYGRNRVYSGPVFRSAERQGNALRLLFDHAGGGLKAQGDTLKGFAIAGPDRAFVWADARIEDGALVVSSPQVENPVAVRYGWADNPTGNLYNAEGLPATPFRTDDWALAPQEEEAVPEE